MSMTLTQRLVPIRPSPAKQLSNRSLTIFGSPSSTLTPPRGGIKRKYEEEPSESEKSCKRKISFSQTYQEPQSSANVAKRNARERNRVKQVNTGYATLRQHIPGASKAKKISKVDTLKQALDYIVQLKGILEAHDSITNESNSSAPVSQAIFTSIPQSQYTYTGQYAYSELISPASTVYSSSTAAPSPGLSDGTNMSPAYRNDTPPSQADNQEAASSGAQVEFDMCQNYFFPEMYSQEIMTRAFPSDDILNNIVDWEDNA